MEGAQEPIEVELASHSGVGHGRVDPRGTGEPAPTEPGAAPGRTGWAHSERGRLSIGAVAAAMLALLVGWTLGRATGPADDTGAATISAAGPVTVPATVDTIAPVESTTAATSTVAVTPTPASSPTEVVAGVRSVELHEAMVGQPIEIVSILSSGRLAVLDLGAATVDERPVERQPFGPGGIHAGVGWVLLPSWDDDLPWTLVTEGGVSEVELGSASRVLPVVGADTFWRIDDDLVAGRPGLAEEIRFDGTRTGVTLEVPTTPGSSDPAGGLLVSAVGGVYRVEELEISQLSGGSVLGVIATHAVVFECDDQMRCGYQLVDRGSAGRTAVVPKAEFAANPPFERPQWPLPSPVLSSDAGAMITIWTDARSGTVRQVLGVLDLVSGDFHELMPARTHASIGWSADGSFVFFADGGRLFAFVRATGEIVTVTGDLFAVEAFALRPAES